VTRSEYFSRRRAHFEAAANSDGTAAISVYTFGAGEQAAEPREVASEPPEVGIDEFVSDAARTPVLAPPMILPARILLGRPGAIRKLLELQPAFVEPVDRIEERFRLARVDEDRIPSAPHFSQTSSSLGSSTAPLPFESLTVRPRS